MCPKRLEKDNLGEMQIPNISYFGIQTARSVELFNISEIYEPLEFVIAFIQIKKACAIANMELELLPTDKGSAIVKACDETLAGANICQFITDIFHGGSGVAFNMNVNEVIANRALEILGYPKGSYGIISPYGEVNMSQGDSDVFSSAARLSILTMSAKLVGALNELKSAFLQKSLEFDFILRPARNNFRDSLPMSLGQVFLTYAETIKKCVEDLEYSKKRLLCLNIGGSEIGTGFNTDKLFLDTVIKRIAELSKIDVLKSEDLVELASSSYDFTNYSAGLKNIALSLIKISSELSLLASGPENGFNEIIIPPLMNGSSMVPGKMNPVLLENLAMVSMQVAGIDHIISYATVLTPPDLNINVPLIAYNLLFGHKILANAVNMVAQKCILGIKANEETLKVYFENSPALIAAITPRVGYDGASALLIEARAAKMSVLKLIAEKKLMSDEEINLLKTARRVSEPGFLLKK